MRTNLNNLYYQTLSDCCSIFLSILAYFIMMASGTFGYLIHLAKVIKAVLKNLMVSMFLKETNILGDMKAF